MEIETKKFGDLTEEEKQRLKDKFVESEEGE